MQFFSRISYMTRSIVNSYMGMGCYKIVEISSVKSKICGIMEAVDSGLDGG